MRDGRIPVTLVTGFLGSGKTTLLAAILRRSDFARTAVVINEFGEVPLDQALIDRCDGHVVVTAGGCLCCGIGGDVVSTLLDLYGRKEDLPFDRVIIETSGLADPGPIMAPLIQSPELTPLFSLDGVVTVVDALQGQRELGRQRVAIKQVAMADRIILSKSDIAAPRAVIALDEQLEALNPWASRLTACHGNVEPSWLFSGLLIPKDYIHFDDHDDDRDHDHHDHGGIRAFCLWPDNGRDWAEVSNTIRTLLDEHGERILRLKGLWNREGNPLAIHGVRQFLHPATPLAAWPDDDHRSRLVFITDHLDRAEVERFLS